jgi:hypothetical protein
MSGTMNCKLNISKLDKMFSVQWLSTPRPTPNLEDQASVFVTLGDRVTQLYPQTLGTHCTLLPDA